MEDLDGAVARRLRFGPRIGAKSMETHLPIDLAAVEAKDLARRSILNWTIWVTDIRHHDVPRTWGAVGTYLQNATEWISAHPDGAICIEKLTSAIRVALRAVDRPAPQQYVGTCRTTTYIGSPSTGLQVIATEVALACSEQLYAPPNTDEIACPRCGRIHNVQERRREMLVRGRDAELSATDLARAIGGPNFHVTPGQISQWHKRGILQPLMNSDGITKTNSGGHVVYRVGDVLDIVTRRIRRFSE